MGLHEEYLSRDRLRDKEIIELRTQGWSYQQLADKYAVTRQRIYQLIKRLKEEGRLKYVSPYDKNPAY